MLEYSHSQIRGSIEDRMKKNGESQSQTSNRETRKYFQSTLVPMDSATEAKEDLYSAIKAINEQLKALRALGDSSGTFVTGFNHPFDRLEPTFSSPWEHLASANKKTIISIATYQTKFLEMEAKFAKGLRDIALKVCGFLMIL